MKYISISNSAPIIDNLWMKTQNISEEKDYVDTYPQENSQEKKKVQYVGKTILKR